MRNRARGYGGWGQVAAFKHVLSQVHPCRPMLVALALSACAAPGPPLYWTKDGGDWKRDDYECARDAIGAGALIYVGFGITTREPDGRVYSACMRSRGYVLQAQEVAPTRVNLNAPPSSMEGFARNDRVMCGFPNNTPVAMTAFTCSQGRGTILGAEHK